MKVGTTRRMVSGAYGNRCGGINLSILENLVIFIDDITQNIFIVIVSYKLRSFLVIGPL